MRWTYILFDLDGTLTDSSPGITNSIIYARRKWGLEPGKNEDYLKFIGPPMPDSFEQFWGFSHGDAVRFLADYREYFSEKGLFENAVYPGIPELLRDLRAAGAHLCVATTKPTVFSERIADRFGFRTYFDMISGSGMKDDNTKYAVIEAARAACGIDMARAVMIGDRAHDVEGAHGHGIPCIGVTWGFGDPGELQAAGADCIADTVDELRELLLG